MAQATSVRFTYIVKMPGDHMGRLEPAPSLTESLAISDKLANVPPLENPEDLLFGSIHVMHATYRGGQIFLYPNVHFNRYRPVRGFVYTNASWPEVGDKETVELRINGQVYEAQVEFV